MKKPREQNLGQFWPPFPLCKHFPTMAVIIFRAKCCGFLSKPPFPLIFSRGLYTTPKSSSSDRQEVTTYEKSYEETLKDPFKKLKLSLLQVSIIHILFATSKVWFLSLTFIFLLKNSGGKKFTYVMSACEFISQL